MHLKSQPYTIIKTQLNQTTAQPTTNKQPNSQTLTQNKPATTRKSTNQVYQIQITQVGAKSNQNPTTSSKLKAIKPNYKSK